MRSNPSAYPRPRRSLVGALVVALALVAACSDDGAGTASTSRATIAVSTTPPTLPPTTERVTTTTEAATTTTEAPQPVYPLTGLPLDNMLVAARPALVAKVGNYDSHPQTGMNTADLVYEEIINDNVSRFAMVFHSQAPADAVGPIRSGRIQDVNLLGSLNRPILAWSGGNRTVNAEIANSDLIDMSPSKCNGACFRANFDDAPYNLYFDINRAWEVAPPDGGTPPQQFQYRGEADPLAGAPSTGVAVQMDSYEIAWTWNPISGLYERQQNGRADKERSGELVTTNNIVILVMEYLPGISNSPDAQSVGTGEVYVFTGGNMVHGTWTRFVREAPFTLTDDAGNPILLTPGRTFIELPRLGGNVVPNAA